MICNRRVPASVTVVRPALLYGLEVVALTKRQVAELEVAELEMLLFRWEK